MTATRMLPGDTDLLALHRRFPERYPLLPPKASPAAPRVRAGTCCSSRTARASSAIATASARSMASHSMADFSMRSTRPSRLSFSLREKVANGRMRVRSTGKDSTQQPASSVTEASRPQSIFRWEREDKQQSLFEAAGRCTWAMSSPTKSNRHCDCPYPKPTYCRLRWHCAVPPRCCDIANKAPWSLSPRPASCRCSMRCLTTSTLQRHKPPLDGLPPSPSTKTIRNTSSMASPACTTTCSPATCSRSISRARGARGSHRRLRRARSTNACARPTPRRSLRPSSSPAGRWRVHRPSAWSAYATA